VAFVADAIWGCYRNALSLAVEAQAIMARGNHALALSISIIALEELSKATFIDGLLFAKAGDDKTKMFESGYRRHERKLERVPYLHLFVMKVAMTCDSRWTGDPKFQQALAISTRLDQKIIDQISSTLGLGHGFESLDAWKQRGLYVNMTTGGLPEAPEKAIPRDLARDVVLLANRLATTFDFVMAENRGSYEKVAQEIRSKMSEDDHAQLERDIAAMYDDAILPSEEPDSKNGPH